MHGAKGSPVRARVITAEFLFGAVVGPLFALFVLLTAPSPVWKAIGLVLLGIGLNYVPLARHALELRAPGAVGAELDGLDVEAEVRRASVVQLWVCVPLALLVFDRRNARSARTGAEAGAEVGPGTGAEAGDVAGAD